MLKCLLHLGQLQTMMHHIDGATLRHARSAAGPFSTYAVQAAWRLGMWERVEEFVPDEDADALQPLPFEVGLAKLLLSVRDVSVAKVRLDAGDSERSRFDTVTTKFEAQMRKVRRSLMELLRAASMESYERAYPLILQSHMLREVECAYNHLRGVEEMSMADWDERLKITSCTLAAQEPILSLRRQLLMLCGLRDEADKVLLLYSRRARAVGDFQAANSTLLQASMAKSLGLAPNIERAKLEWEQATALSRHTAIQEIKHILDRSASSQRSAEVTKARLLYGEWMHHQMLLPPDRLLKHYDELVKDEPHNEKCNFFLGRFLDDLMRATLDNYAKQGAIASSRARPSQIDALDGPYQHLPRTLRHYGQSLALGHKYIFQSLPRLLTLWFEFGTAIARAMPRQGPQPSSHGASAQYGGRKAAAPAAAPAGQMHAKVHGEISDLIRKLPVHVWLTVLPQLISRITHEHDQTRELLKQLLAKLMYTYLDEVMWQFVFVLKSKQPLRKKVANEVLTLVRNNFREKKPEKTAVMDTMLRLTDVLMELCNFGSKIEMRGKQSFSISKDYKRNINRLIAESSIVIPTQLALTAVLPATAATASKHEPYPSQRVTISKFEDVVNIMASLQRPAKVGFLGSDGKLRYFLCKPKDDLRKDLRMMDFAVMLNRLFRKDIECRRRKLQMRTFAVVPMSEECGLIEWVDNTKGLRFVLRDLYDKDGLGLKTTDISTTYNSIKPRGPLTELQCLEKILTHFPPVLHKWFTSQFPNATKWFESRQRYARTAGGYRRWS